MSSATQYVDATEYQRLKREHEKLKDEHARLYRATSDIQRKSYDEGREDTRREHMSSGSVVQMGDGLAHLALPDNGGAIQFHVVRALGARPLIGGILTPNPDFSLRIWGPPDESGSYGVHEQGGGNLTDFSMSFDLTPQGIVIHRMDVTGLRTQWDREPHLAGGCARASVRRNARRERED